MLRWFKQWLKRRDDGTVAVEFGLLGVPFITMLIGTFELSLFFASSVVMEGATNYAARLIRTGQVQTAANPIQVFEDNLCDRVGLMIDCEDVEYEVVPVPGDNFANAGALAPTYDAAGNLVSQGFDPAGSSDVVLIRVVYRYQFLTPFMSEMIMEEGSGNNSMRIVSTVVIQNEPYEFGG